MGWLSTPYNASSANYDATPNVARKTAKWLIIFDNADKPELLRDFWPVSGNGAALVRNRDWLTGTYLHATCGVDLQPFVREEAALFLQRLPADDTASQNDSESKMNKSC